MRAQGVGQRQAEASYIYLHGNTQQRPDSGGEAGRDMSATPGLTSGPSQGLSGLWYVTK